MTPQVQSVDAGATVASVLASHFGPDQRHRAFPVTRDGLLVGMLDREALGAQAPEALVGSLFGINRPPVALAGETCRIVATRLAVHGIERLPVVASAIEPRLLGIVSRSDLIKATAGLHVEEHERRTLRRNPLTRRA